MGYFVMSTLTYYLPSQRITASQRQKSRVRVPGKASMHATNKKSWSVEFISWTGSLGWTGSDLEVLAISVSLGGGLGEVG